MRSPLTIASLLLAGLWCANAHADTQVADKAPETAATEEGMRAYVDPETGELTSRPTDNVLALEFEPQMHMIEEIKHTNGMTEWRFNGQASEAVVATVTADGSVATHCATHGKVDDHVIADKESNREE